MREFDGSGLVALAVERCGDPDLVELAQVEFCEQCKGVVVHRRVVGREGTLHAE